MQVYGDHLETQDGTLVPGPGGCHPALRHVAESIVRMAERVGTVQTIKIPCARIDHASFDEDPVASGIETSTLEFTPHMIQAVDDDGVIWAWYVWIDQYQRGVGSDAWVVVDMDGPLWS